MASEGIRTAFRPYQSLRRCLVKPKDRTPTESQCGVVYRFNCTSCDANYVGQTARPVYERRSEHQKDEVANSAISVHVSDTGHAIDWDSPEILDRDTNLEARLAKEHICIKSLKPQLNRDQGKALPEAYAPLWTRIQSHTHRHTAVRRPSDLGQRSHGQGQIRSEAQPTESGGGQANSQSEL